MMLIVATRYDKVTVQTFAIAERLRREGKELGLQTASLLADEATGDRLREKIADRFRVFAFYAHGDDSGQILAQDGLPIWTEQNIPDFHGGVIFAHACRAMLTLERQLLHLNVSVVVGYRIDLKLPPDGSEVFWEYYRRLHSLLPLRFAQVSTPEAARAEFYELATGFLAETHRRGGGLIELIAVQQSRADREILLKA